MEKSIIQALNNLLPTFSGPLPSELLDHAISLLAQSRNKASSLKPEEEIARSYACANLACERFKKSLGLSEIKINPPCAPKVYQRLYRYLEGVLPVGTKSRTRAPATNKLLATPSPSPIKQKRASKPGTNIEIVARRNQAQHESQAPLSESGWIMPAIRVFCKDLNAPAAPPHVFAGVLSVLTLTPPIKITNEHFTEAKSANGGMSGLLIATCLLVCARLSGVRTHPDDYQRRRDAGLKLLNQSFPQGEACAEDVNRWLRRIRDEGWTRLDWFTNIKEGAGLEIERGSPNSEEPPHIDGATEQEETPRIRRGLISMARVEEISIQAGIGTMFQDKVDYLSDERRMAYKEWKKQILDQIDDCRNQESINHSANET